MRSLSAGSTAGQRAVRPASLREPRGDDGAARRRQIPAPATRMQHPPDRLPPVVLHHQEGVHDQRPHSSPPTPSSSRCSASSRPAARADHHATRELGELLHQQIGVDQLPLNGTYASPSRTSNRPPSGEHQLTPAARRIPGDAGLSPPPAAGTRDRTPIAENADIPRSINERSRSAGNPAHDSWRQPCIPSSWPRAAIYRLRRDTARS